MRLPQKITPDPIKEVVVEIRFESALPADATFGVVYNALRHAYQNAEALPITQIPEFVRSQDPNLIYQPYYKLSKEDFSVQVGPKVLSLVVSKPYPGWDSYMSEILDVFGRVRDLNFITTVERVGLRYIDFFEQDIFKNINLRITVNNEPSVAEQTFVRTLMRKDRFYCVLQIGNQMTVRSIKGEENVGSVIDVDTFATNIGEDFFGQMDALLQEAHTFQKELFFGLLKPEFLALLNPTYKMEQQK